MEYGYLQDCTHTDNIYSVQYVRSKRCILHVPSLEKFVQPFKCYQIILLSLTCQMIDCTGQCESATAQWVNQTIYCNYYLYCLMPDNFAHQGESGFNLVPRVFALGELNTLVWSGHVTRGFCVKWRIVY